ncbi:MAG: translation elongation factor 4 [Saccharofermentanaceae bacterium]|jgi:GTP-binding protein LepA|nr:translation elongation factor 4 [Saccharofermentans sp.]HPE28235.1 translation elongation factor 4 [Saccharofermentans sp.]HPG64019.1 translation elongation factor 4 [Saccharofermentans sp.]HPJ81025.1 translation elongation factor 4 [Saccharofermentans sp.]HPQ31567.1 translation elongation factor 4 [Saccharofermentans sp.]
MNRQELIRNFCIIAHIDHGKSTLADRLIEQTGVVEKREMQAQILDNMAIERERGITIKAQATRMAYKASDGNTYEFNLIDTPGHVDFNYEVSRSLAACDGAILVVDAAQGVEAQTLANVYLAVDANLEVLPVINKVDLPSAQPDVVKNEIEEVIGIDASYAPLISAKSGLGIEEVLEKIVQYLPCPSGDEDAPLRALIFDSKFDPYKGVILSCRVREGKVRLGEKIRVMHTGKEFVVTELGYFHPGEYVPSDKLQAGEVGYICASIKNVSDTAPGDTVTLADMPAVEPLKGYKEIQQMVFCGMYPIDGARYGDLRDSLEKLRLNDAALSFEAETSVALGFGFRCGFLGLLHYEVIMERLEREFNLDLISTAPSVVYRVYKTDSQMIEVDNPTNMPDPSVIDYIEEPMVNCTIMLPKDYVGNIMDLCQDRRGEYKDMKYLDETRVMLHYRMPLNEIIYDFFDCLKSRTRGYASLDYEINGYDKSDLVKLDILLNSEAVDALSFIVHKDKAYARGRRMVEKLKDNIPRQQFEIPIQACIGGRIIARETIRAFRKDVIAKCYGGDISRKKKLLEKQKEGKKRMRSVGSVDIPQEAFLSVLKLEED